MLQLLLSDQYYNTFFHSRGTWVGTHPSFARRGHEKVTNSWKSINPYHLSMNSDYTAGAVTGLHPINRR